MYIYIYINIHRKMADETRHYISTCIRHTGIAIECSGGAYIYINGDICCRVSVVAVPGLGACRGKGGVGWVGGNRRGYSRSDKSFTDGSNFTVWVGVFWTRVLSPAMERLKVEGGTKVLEKF